MGRDQPAMIPSPADDERARIEAAVLHHARQNPEFGQARIAAELAATGLRVSASGVRNLLQAHGLETTYKRLKALQKLAGNADALTPTQRELLRRGAVSRKAAQRLGGGSDSGEAAGRRRLILDAAAKRFGERGYDATSVRDIGDAAGLLPGSIYHHFSSKEDLYVEVHKEGFRQLIDTVEAAIAAQTDPWRRLELACETHIQALVAGNTISTVTGVGLFSLHDRHLEKRLQPDRDRYEQIFIRLIAALDLGKRLDRSLLRMFLFGALNWTLVWYRPGKKTPADIARQLVRIVRGD